MTTNTKKWMLVSLGAPGVLLVALASVLSASDGLPLVVTHLAGTLRIQQPVPCRNDVDLLTPVTGGGLELTPSEGLPLPGGGLAFTLTRASLSFAGFTISRSCFGVNATRTYGDIRVQLARVVKFTATPDGRGAFRVTIPKEAFRIYYSAIVGRAFETGYKHPKEDVIGTLDFTSGRVQMQVVLGTRVHFEAGCTTFGCAINETHDGTLTATIAGTMVFPDSDGDRVPDQSDNCRFVANPDQTPVPTPYLAAPADRTLTSCAASGLGRAEAADFCDGGAVRVTSDAPARLPLGRTVVTWTAEDAEGRRATDTQTVIVTDAVPPAVSCDPTHPQGFGFVAFVTDDCTASPRIWLGTYALTPGETIKITETGQRGIRLVNAVGPDRIKHFLVGRGEGVIRATDASGNTATAACIR